MSIFTVKKKYRPLKCFKCFDGVLIKGLKQKKKGLIFEHLGKISLTEIYCVFLQCLTGTQTWWFVEGFSLKRENDVNCLNVQDLQGFLRVSRNFV